MRIGIGYDVHTLVAGRKLVLGGVEIPFEKGLSGWSDADVLIHAVMDALLGAAALGDIGGHFPPGEAEYKDISSMALLKQVNSMLQQNNWKVGNIDATIVAEQPRVSGFISDMRNNLSRALDIELDNMSVKATTTEKLGFVGRGEGIAACAVALLERLA